MAQTDTEVLEAYKLARDRVVAEMGAGTKRVIEIEIRNRRVEYQATQLDLDKIEKMIAFYEKKTAPTSGRSLARLSRNQ